MEGKKKILINSSNWIGVGNALGGAIEYTSGVAD
jgi:hypothetical protein